MALYPTWPASLTDAEWQKKKGSIAKVAGKTGVGEAIKAAKTAFDKIDFNKAEASQIPPAERSEENLTKKAAEALAWHKGTVEPARDKIKDVRDAANKAAASWKKNPVIPKASVKAAEDFAALADNLWIDLKTNSVTMTKILDDYDRMIDTAKRIEEAERAKIATSISNLKKALREVVATPTKAEWGDANTSAHQRCRSMCNAIKAIPSLKKQYWSEWQKYGDFYAKNVVAGSPTEKAEIIAIVKEVGNSLKTFEAGYQKHM